ncbi:APC family permease [Peredibacter starrii]|uniref:Amino acid permease n=1 Tax=Peredibacter starrii TaxID=28202 RepID=A0AAX4HUU3_9BACT|nr:amino acid permease [Peredibacter starrii]WPU66912.1 amino acid permease [Peredibacter starrii]
MSKELVRGLTLVDAASIVVGSIIGTGVFLKTATMSSLVGSPGMVLVIWVVAGLLSLAGALAYSELGTLMPDAGGEYVYLKEGYGDIWAFLYGWMRFWIGSPGSIAAYAVGGMTFLSGAVDLSIVGGRAAASVIVIIVFSSINCLSVAFGGRVQAIMTGLKILIIIGLSAGIFIFSNGGSFSHLTETTPAISGFTGWSAFGAATLAALWAYDGWNNLPMVAGEIKNPQRNIPLSLGLGMLVILAIYCVANVAYFYALPFTEVLTSNSDAFPDAYPVATKAAMTFLGTSGITVLSAAFVFSAMGAMNGSILAGARVPYAMAKDGLFFKQLANVNDVTLVPVVSIIIQGIVSMLLALSGTFDQLTNYVVFSSWIFYAMVTGVVFVLRKRKPDAHRPYKTLGYPVVPIIFIILALLLLVNTVWTSPRESLIGLGFILSGVPVFYLFKRKSRASMARVN